MSKSASLTRLISPRVLSKRRAYAVAGRDQPPECALVPSGPRAVADEVRRLGRAPARRSGGGRSSEGSHHGWGARDRTAGVAQGPCVNGVCGRLDVPRSLAGLLR